MSYENITNRAGDIIMVGGKPAIAGKHDLGNQAMNMVLVDIEAQVMEGHWYYGMQNGVLTVKKRVRVGGHLPIIYAAWEKVVASYGFIHKDLSPISLRDVESWIARGGNYGDTIEVEVGCEDLSELPDDVAAMNKELAEVEQIYQDALTEVGVLSGGKYKTSVILDQLRDMAIRAIKEKHAK